MYKWRYVVYKTHPMNDSLSPCGHIVAIGQVDRPTQHATNIALNSKPVESGTPIVKIFVSHDGEYVCKAYRSDANGYADIGRLTLGQALYSVDGW